MGVGFVEGKDEAAQDLLKRLDAPRLRARPSRFDDGLFSQSHDVGGQKSAQSFFHREMAIYSL